MGLAKGLGWIVLSDSIPMLAARVPGTSPRRPMHLPMGFSAQIQGFHNAPKAIKGAKMAYFMINIINNCPPDVSIDSLFTFKH